MLRLALLFFVFTPHFLTGSAVTTEEPPVECSFANQLLPDPSSCENYYQCDANLTPQLFTCGTGLAFSTVTQACDLAVDVDCEDGVRPDDTTTSITETLPTTTEQPFPFNCTEVGELHADPNNCGMFYECDGLLNPAHLPCPDGEYFNEEDKICDYPINVDCGDRPTLNPTDSTAATTLTDQPTTTELPTTTEAPTTTEVLTTTEAPTTETTPVPTSATTSQAGPTCAHVGDFLIDPNDCQSFYHCDSDKNPVHETCPDGSLYDPEILNCNNAENVDCGDRPINQ